jgi:hypothetical protein
LRVGPAIIRIARNRPYSLDDVVVVERRLDLTLTFESGPEPRVVAEIGCKQLQRHDPVERQLSGFVDRPHAPLSEYPIDAIPGNDGALL